MGHRDPRRCGHNRHTQNVCAGANLRQLELPVSATGDGEYFIRLTIARDICARMQYQKLTVAQAADTVIFGVLGKTKGTGGVIVLDNQGNVAMPFNTTRHVPWDDEL